jgi:hypothetical protein
VSLDIYLRNPVVIIISLSLLFLFSILRVCAFWKICQFSVLSASLIFSLYLCMWHEHEHTHDENDNSHPHTTQQKRALTVNKTHKHVHYSGMPCGQDAVVMAHDHSHGHSHDHA